MQRAARIDDLAELQAIAPGGEWFFAPLPPPRDVRSSNIPKEWESFGTIPDVHAITFDRAGYLVYWCERADKPLIAAYCGVAAPKATSEHKAVMNSYGRIIAELERENTRLIARVETLQSEVTSCHEEIALLQEALEKAQATAKDADDFDFMRGISAALNIATKMRGA